MQIVRTGKHGRATTVASLIVAIVFLSPLAVEAQQTSHSSQSMAARIQRLEDIEEIRNLLTDYGRFLDAHDLVAYSNLFAKEGEWVGGFGTGQGPAGAKLEQSRAASQARAAVRGGTGENGSRTKLHTMFPDEGPYRRELYPRHMEF